MADLKQYIGSTPQSEQADSRQVMNHAKGYTFQTSDIQFVKRFLIMGSEGTMYQPKHSITVNALQHVKKLASTNPELLASLAKEVSVNNKSIKNDYAIIALAILWSTKTDKSREAVEQVFFDIIRIPTHLFMFLEYLKQINGKIKVGRRLRKLITLFYTRDRDTIFYQILKYQSREGWSHKDVLKIGHPKISDEEVRKLVSFLLRKETTELPTHPLFEAFIKLRNASTENEVVQIIENSNVTWEFVPSKWLNSKKVWNVLLPKLPTTALLRNLGRLTSLGVLEPFSDNTKFVYENLIDPVLPKRAKIHPLHVANAQAVYNLGHSFRGSLQWTRVSAISEALEQLLWNAFDSLESTHKKYYVAVDVSGSMWWSNKFVLKSGEIASILALSLVKAESDLNIYTAAFSDTMLEFNISKTTNLTQMFRDLKNLPWGGTDCALPMLDAINKKLDIDTFLILTDNETWYGDIHPHEALNKYRNRFNSNAKLCVCGLETTSFTIADPDDPYSLDIAGFDPALPKIVQEFSLM